MQKLNITVDFYVPSIVCDEAVISTDGNSQFTYIFTVQKAKFSSDKLFMFDQDFHDKNLVMVKEDDTSGIIIHGREEEVVTWLKKQANEDRLQREDFAQEIIDKNLEVKIPPKYKKEFPITNTKTEHILTNCYICGVEYGYNKVEVIAKEAKK